jgi:hypothetical protein
MSDPDYPARLRELVRQCRRAATTPTDEDIDDARSYVDLYLENHASIHGVLIAGWEGFAGVIDHLRFVRDYHTKIDRAALVTDIHLPPGADALAKHFVGATVRHFSYADYDKALRWLKTRLDILGAEQAPDVL